MSLMVRWVIVGEAWRFGERVGVVCIGWDGRVFIGGSGGVDRLVVHAVLILLWEINRCKNASLVGH